MTSPVWTGVLLVNPYAGSQRETPEAVAKLLPTLELRVCEPAALHRELVAAVAAGADVVAVAGGDGTMRTAAGVLRNTASTLLPVPLGTFNHFARSLGIDTVEAAAEALERGTAVRIDIGEVNEEPFVNNASIGWYAEMLKTRRRLSHKMPRQLAKLVALLLHLPKAPRFDVELSGRPFRTWLVWVGNGTYDLRVGHLSERRSLMDHRLDVRILVAERRLARLRAAWALLAGNVEGSDALQRFTPAEVTFRVARPTVAVAVDGDGIGPPPPLHFRSVPAVLSVLPSPAWTAARPADGDQPVSSGMAEWDAVERRERHRRGRRR
jgi:diacylglycerol kinase family enzyme